MLQNYLVATLFRNISDDQLKKYSYHISRPSVQRVITNYTMKKYGESLTTQRLYFREKNAESEENKG